MQGKDWVIMAVHSFEVYSGKAQYFIAECYRYARGVRLNQKKAIEWYKKAAEQGHTLAKEALKKMRIVI